MCPSGVIRSGRIHPEVKPRNAQTNLKPPQRATSQTLQAMGGMLNVKLYDSTIRKRLNKYGLEGLPRKSLSW